VTALRGGDERSKNMEQVVLKWDNLAEQLRISANGMSRLVTSSISDLVAQAYPDDPLPIKILNAIRHGDSLKDVTVGECTEQEGQAGYRRKGCVPEGAQLLLQLIQDHHDTALAGHPAHTKTCNHVNRKHSLTAMRKQMDHHI
jgi:hypothetical protein